MVVIEGVEPYLQVLMRDRRALRISRKLFWHFRIPVTNAVLATPQSLDSISQDARFGGIRGDRTLDLLHAMQMLSQLSYDPERYRLNLSVGSDPVPKPARLRAKRLSIETSSRRGLLAWIRTKARPRWAVLPLNYQSYTSVLAFGGGVQDRTVSKVLQRHQ